MPSQDRAPAFGAGGPGFESPRARDPLIIEDLDLFIRGFGSRFYVRGVNSRVSSQMISKFLLNGFGGLTSRALVMM